MMMSSGVRKTVLTLHITVSVGWIGAVVAFLAIVVAAMMDQEPQMLRAAWIAMALVGWFAIVPLAVASLITGLLMALGTKWGLFRHYWVLLSVVLTVIAVLVLWGNMQTVRYYASIAENEGGDVGILRDGLWSELFHGGIGLVVLVVIQVLNVYKPRGLTPYGWRRQQQQRMLRQGQVGVG